MASLNRILLIGNLGKEPELKYIPSGQAVCTLRLAVTEGFRTKAGEDKKETLWVDVVVWGKQGENCAQYLKKGRSA
ncbi:MAG: single-stranded DNA-binding protein, partial [bacterium]